MRTTLVTLGLILALATTLVANEKNAEKKAEPAVAAAALTTLSGVVVDRITGEPLTGVEVCLEGTGLKAYTDFDGNYQFSNLNPGDYSVSVSLISYLNGKKSISLKNASANTVKLELETVKQ